MRFSAGCYRGVNPLRFSPRARGKISEVRRDWERYIARRYFVSPLRRENDTGLIRSYECSTCAFFLNNGLAIFSKF